jgi:hypothetical protein
MTMPHGVFRHIGREHNAWHVYSALTFTENTHCVTPFDYLNSPPTQLRHINSYFVDKLIEVQRDKSINEV